MKKLLVILICLMFASWAFADPLASPGGGVVGDAASLVYEGEFTVIGATAITTPITYPIKKNMGGAITVTNINCITDTGTVIVDLQEGSGTAFTGGTDVSTSPITCDTNGQAATTISNAVIDLNDWIAARIGTDASSPTVLNITYSYTK